MKELDWRMDNYVSEVIEVPSNPNKRTGSLLSVLVPEDTPVADTAPPQSVPLTMSSDVYNLV